MNTETMNETAQAAPVVVAATGRTRTPIVKKFEENGTVVTITFMNDAVHTIDLATLTSDLQMACAMHGLGQKLRDNFAGVVKDAEKSEVPISPVDLASQYTAELIAQLQSGQWKAERTPGEPRETPVDILAQAIVAIAAEAGKQADMDKVLVMLTAKTKEQRAELSKAPNIKAAVAAIRAAKAAPTAQADLSEFLV